MSAISSCSDTVNSVVVYATVTQSKSKFLAVFLQPHPARRIFQKQRSFLIPSRLKKDASTCS